MENLLEKAKQLGAAYHREVNHKYDNEPYALHLHMVYSTALNFIHLISKEYKEIVLASCWLHDTIEDTRKTYNDIRNVTNTSVADIVYALTNEKGKNRKERANEKYYKGIKEIKHASFVKICDRIANIEYSKQTGSKMFAVYKNENEEFKQRLYDEQYKEMFVHMENILLK